MKLRKGFTALLLALFANVLPGVADAALLTGNVRDGRNTLLAGATVIVYSANPRKGYSPVCPTCYPDSGKRTTTDVQGNFSISGLDGKLVFDVIVAHEGQTSVWMGRVDPLQGGVQVTMRPLPPAEPGNTVLGRVVDSRGQGVPHAPIAMVGIVFAGNRRVPGNFPDALAVSNAEGFFELRSLAPGMLTTREPVESVILHVMPRGMAPAFHVARLGRTAQELRVAGGATIKGRVLAQGKPVSKAQLLLLPVARVAVENHEPLYIGTDDKGQFTISNVPAGLEWSLDANSDSGMGGVAARLVTTTEGETVDLGDVEVRSGHSLAGRIVLSDGKMIPFNMPVGISSSANGSRHGVLSTDGRFEFKGLSGPYQLAFALPGYRLAQGSSYDLRVDKNVKGLVIKLEPVP